MSQKIRLLLLWPACSVALLLLALARPLSAATISIVNNDGPGEGFNDTTPVAPVGGNPGTTIGAQRMNAFQFAANLWAARLDSSVTIKVGAQFNALPCSTSSGVLGQAGPNSVFRDFAGAPQPNTWYVEAQANSLAGVDLDPSSDDLDATFSSNIGTPGCLESTGWYYGLDGNTPANRIDFVAVLLHEMGHGLGFLSLVNLGSGAKFSGLDDAYMQFLENHSTGESYPTMTNAERIAASKNDHNLHWIGANVIAEGAGLTTGTLSGHVWMYAPPSQQPGSSVSHWDTALTPNQLMEPRYTGPLHEFELELAAFQDMGWSILAPTPCGDGVIDAGEECDDGGILNGDGCSGACQIETCSACVGEPSSCSFDPNCGLSLRHFLFYKVQTSPGTPKFVAPPPVLLADQFETKTYTVTKPLALGNPANKNNEDPSAVSDTKHLKAYQLGTPPGTLPHVPHTVQVDNQFGTIFVKTSKPDRLLVPTAKSLVGPIPPLVNPALDHFKCYPVTIATGTPAFPAGIQATAVDQFNQPKTYAIKKPLRLCNPVSVNGEPIQDPDAHLMCYQVRRALGQPNHLRLDHIHVNNPFGPEQLKTIKDEELCLPSVKTD
ncbi:MAG: hypothetical protein HYZ50_10265 [Deltaproteobacteria bacterium]|nr:hypothetical protein [Deltaproteobacteria bacterium]